MFIDIDTYLKSGKEEELFKSIQRRKAQIEEEEEKKAKAEADAKIHAEKVKKSRESAIKAFKYYMETLLGTKVTDAEVQELIDAFIDLEKKIARINEMEKNFKKSNLNDEEKIRELMNKIFFYNNRL